MSAKDAATAKRAGRNYSRTQMSGGMYAVNQAIATCYARAFQLASRDAILYCITFDSMAFQTDQSFRKQSNMPPLEFNAPERTQQRIAYAFNRQAFGLQPTDADLCKKMINAGFTAAIEEINEINKSNRKAEQRKVQQQRAREQNFNPLCSLLGCR
jgi:hypothetical protein